MMAGLLDMYFPAEDPMAPAALVPAGLLNGDGSRALNKARGLLAEQPGYAYGSILPFKRDTATDDLSFAIPGFARDSATGILDMLEGKMTPEASMSLLDIPIGGLLHAGVTGARQTPETLAAIRAYHGSPHRFDRFDMGKIGTGEGAQAYGHGLYFAEAEDTARTYQKALANIAHPDRGPEWVAKQWLSENGGDVATAEAALRESITSWKSDPIANNDPQLREMIANMESAIPLLGRVTPEPGALYTARLNVEPDDLLDWDKPLSEQSAKVRAALEKANPVKIREGQAYIGDTLLGPADHGEEINFWNGILRSGAGNAYKQIERAAGKQEAARIFREAGIPGIRYLDQGSRGAGEGTRNFVIFDDKLIDIEGVQ